MRSSYPLKALEEFGVWVGGGTPARSNRAFWTNGTIPWVSPTDMGTQRLNGALEYITPEAVTQSATSLVPKHATIIVVRSGILRKRIPIAIAEVACAINQDLKALVPYVVDEGRYIFHALRALEPTILARTQKVGTTVESLDFPLVKCFQVPDPGRDVKVAIADVLDAIDDAIVETNSIIEKHEAVRLGLLDDLIACPAQIGHSEAPQTLADVIGSISSGCSVNADDRPPAAGEFGVLKTSAVGGGRFRPRASKAVWPEEIDRLKCPVAAGLILFSRMNTPQLVGENAFVEQDHPGLFLPDRLWAIRVKEDEGVLPEWVATILQTRHARAFITGEATGTSGSMKNIARTSLLRLPIRKMPEQDQMDAVSAVRAFQTEMDSLTTERDKLAALRLGLRDDLLTGRVPVVAILEAAE